MVIKKKDIAIIAKKIRSNKYTLLNTGELNITINNKTIKISNKPLPERWFLVWKNEKEIDLINKFFWNNHNNPRDYKWNYLKDSMCYFDNEIIRGKYNPYCSKGEECYLITQGYKEITFEEFKKIYLLYEN